jgi:hypothetical protein
MVGRREGVAGYRRTWVTRTLTTTRACINPTLGVGGGDTGPQRQASSNPENVAVPPYTRGVPSEDDNERGPERGGVEA